MPLVVHYWADMQSGHGLRCYGNVTRTRNVSEYMLVLAVCLVYYCKKFIAKCVGKRILKTGQHLTKLGAK